MGSGQSGRLIIAIIFYLERYETSQSRSVKTFGAREWPARRSSKKIVSSIMIHHVGILASRKISFFGDKGKMSNHTNE